MAQKSTETALALKIQATPGIFDTPTLPADFLRVANLRPQISSVTIDNPEYTGSVARNAPDVTGKTFTMAFNILMRPPGGSGVPGANEYLPGRVLQACKFTEIRNTVAIPEAPEAVGAGSTTTKAVLGASASAVAQTYKGFPLWLSDNGTGLKRQTTVIVDYDANKGASLAETLGAPPAADYQILPFLGYYRSVDASDPPMLSMQVWYGGNRYDLVDVQVTGLRIPVNTSTKTQGSYPAWEVTVSATIHASAAEASPAVTPGGTTPTFKDGDQWLAGKAVGGASFTIDMGIQSEDPPNPNQPDGSDPSEIVSSTARMSMQRQFYSKDVFDTLGMADAQQQHPFWAQWGYGSGTIIGVVVPQARFDFPNPDLGGALVNETGDLMIDAFDRSVGIYFPY